MEELKIDPGFKALIPPLSPDEYAQLEQNILEDGCRDPIVVWVEHFDSMYCKYCQKDVNVKAGDGIWQCCECEYGLMPRDELIVDGHNRYEICRKHGIEFETELFEFDSRQDVRVWMRNNQMGRRNLTAAWRIELELGNKEDLAKIGAAKKVESGKSARDKQLGVLSQIDKTPEPKHDTRKAIAKAAGTSTGMVGMAEQVRKKSPELWEKAKQGEVTVGAAYRELKGAESKPKAHVANNTGNNEWYTPAKYIESARAVMGSIDVDPASSEAANAVVGASVFYDVSKDGLKQEWKGNIWMNPPYAQPLIGDFCAYLKSEIDSGRVVQFCVLVNNATETKWFQVLASVATCICFPSGRIRFVDPEGNESGAPLQGQAILYAGKNTQNFVVEFSKYGFCVAVDHE